MNSSKKIEPNAIKSQQITFKLISKDWRATSGSNVQPVIPIALNRALGPVWLLSYLQKAVINRFCGFTKFQDFF